MEAATILLFVATVLPLICTPGPDMLFVASQALSGGAAAGLRSTAGICLGYVVHSALVALGVAAIVAASPVIFEALRWFGVAYLAGLAVQLIRSALMAGPVARSAEPTRRPLRLGFLTAALNPKGMMIYVAILPQFITEIGSIGLQVLTLSAVFVSLCALVYATLSLAIAALGGRAGFSDRRRRWIEGTAGGLLIVAAGRLAAT